MTLMNDELVITQQEDENSLSHYGVKGQKWGQRNYQNPDGTYTELGKIRRRVAFTRAEEAAKAEQVEKAGNQNSSSKETDEKITGKAYKDMTRKELRAAKKRARHNEAERRAQREFNRDKREAIESGDMSFISRNISKFTNDEIDEAIVRYNKMQNLKNLKEAEDKRTTEYFMDKAANFLNRTERMVTPAANIINKLNEVSKKASEKRSQRISEKKNATELAYLINPASKPLTKTDELKNEKQRIENEKAKNEGIQTRIDTRWKEFIDEEKYKDYHEKSIEDFKNKWGSYDNSSSGKGNKGGGDGKKDKKASKEDAINKSKSVDWQDEDSVEKFFTDMGFTGQNKNKLTSWFSKKNKEDVKGTDFDLDDKRTNSITKKYLGKLKSSDKDAFSDNYVDENQWKKDMKKHDAQVVDKWVKDMKKKYMNEQGLSSEMAEKKAEDYVDSWLESYDDQLLKELKKYT